MSFSDDIRKSIIDSFMANDVSTLDVCLILATTLVLALYIFVLYRIMNRKNIYNKNFNISLVLMAVITAAIVITLQSSIVVSLGIIGTLSIVRFRTAIKDPLDLICLFWALSIGIICGIELFDVAILASVIISVIVFILDVLPISKTSTIMVVRGGSIVKEKELLEIIRKYTKYYKIRIHEGKKGKLNLILEIRTNNAECLLDSVYQIDGIEHVSIIDQNGETSF